MAAPAPLDPAVIDHFVQLALLEDRAGEDVTVAAVVPAAARMTTQITAREPLVLAGLALAEGCFRALDPTLNWQSLAKDGAELPAGAVVARLSGLAGPMLSAERSALNFLQHLSGIATLTARYVSAVAGTGVIILDTRKTLAGLRVLAKYATALGGAQNYRQELASRAMIKDNHILAAGSLDQALAAAAQANLPDLVVECDTLAQVQRCLAAKIGHLLLDNMSLDQLQGAVAMGRSAGYPVKLEASGGVTLTTIRGIAETGVDFISVGRLTQSAPAVDIGLDGAVIG
jgi:nicotinate-nucleotide pyrophosphorylase (carboxylating)